MKPFSTHSSFARQLLQHTRRTCRFSLVRVITAALLCGTWITAVQAGNMSESTATQVSSGTLLVASPVYLTSLNAGALTLEPVHLLSTGGSAGAATTYPLLPLSAPTAAEPAGPGAAEWHPGFTADGMEMEIVYIPEPGTVGISVLIAAFLLWRSRERLRQLFIRSGLALLRVVG